MTVKLTGYEERMEQKYNIICSCMNAPTFKYIFQHSTRTDLP